MEILALTLLIAFQTGAFVEFEPKDGVLINVPQTVGAHSWVNQPAYVSEAGATPINASRNQNLVRQQYDYSCGSAALTTLLRFYLGLNLSEKQVMNGMLQFGEREKILARRGFSLADMKRLSQALGYKSAGFRGEFDDLKTLSEPAILRITYGDFQHFVVLRDIVGGRVFLADPAFGNISLTQEEFLDIWDGILFIVSAKNSQKTFQGLELRESDLALMSEQDIPDSFASAIPGYYQQLDQGIDEAARSTLYFKP